MAGGTDGALVWLSSPMDVVAIGLPGSGVFGLIEACFRILQDVPVDAMGRRTTGR